MDTRKQSLPTILRHLKQLLAHLRENDFSTLAQDRALLEAIKLLGEK